MQKIKDNVYVETEFLGCNPSFVVTSEGIVMIDAPGVRPREALAWRAEIERHGKLLYIINTDHHADHLFGDSFFTGDLIVHKGTMEKLLNGDLIEGYKAFVKLIDPQSEVFTTHYFVRKPKFTYSDKMTLYCGGEIFELIYTRGHTEYETVVYLPLKKVLFTGDNVCTNGIPNLSESFPIEWLKFLGFIERLEIDVLVPGHGQIGNKSSIAGFREQLVSLLRRVKEHIDKGSSREEIMGKVSYEDNVHRKYPQQTSERFTSKIKLSIGRLYDELRRYEAGGGSLDLIQTSDNR